MERVSVIVPVYNTERYLNRCIDSILAQTYCDLELILVDDGSTDQSGEICEQYLKKDSRVRVFHQSNQGQAVARNYALDWVYSNSDSQWITFVDSDDWIHPKMVEILYRAAVNSCSKISVCGYEMTHGKMPDIFENQIKTHILGVEDFYCKYADVWSVVPWGKLYHRDCFEEIRYPIVRACEDEYVTYKVLFQSPQFPVIEAPLYAYFMSDNSTMRSKWSPKRLAVIKAFEQRVLFFEQTQYQNAWLLSVKLYLLWGLYGQINQIEELPNASDFEKERKQLLQKLRIGLLRYRKKGKIDIPTYIQLYEKAYPHSMQIYWFIKSKVYVIKHKLKQ